MNSAMVDARLQVVADHHVVDNLFEVLANVIHYLALSLAFYPDLLFVYFGRNACNQLEKFVLEICFIFSY
jgi:hypothetical protein